MRAWQTGWRRRLGVVAWVALVAAFVSAQGLLEVRKAVAERPSDPTAWTALAGALVRDAQWASAKDAYLEAIALDYLAGDAHFGLGLLELRRGDLAAALFSFSEVARLFPDRFEGHHNQGVVFARLGRFADAAQAFERAIAAADPEATARERVAAWAGLGAVHLQAGRPLAAADAFGQAAALDPNNPEPLFQRAAALLAAGLGREALADLTALEARGFDHRASLMIANIYLAEGQTDRALRVLERAERAALGVQDVSGQAAAWLAMGDLAAGLGRFNDALDAYARAMVIDPGSWQARYALAHTLVAMGEPHNAVQPMLEARLLAPNEAGLALGHAALLERLERWEEVVAVAGEALALGLDAPQAAVAQAAVGRAAVRLGAFRTAQGAFDTLLEINPDDADAWLWAGYTRELQGDALGAVERYQRAIALNPNQRVARLNMAGGFMALRRYSEAAGIYRLLLQQDSRDGGVHHQLAWALYGDSRVDDARAAWAEACRLGHTPACRAP